MKSKRPHKTSGPRKSTKESPGGSKNFPIVGVGASAGGLEAFRHLLQNLPTDTGMAFVLVQHLDPTHASALTTLLAKATPMPVREVTDRLKVQPNQVYVIPPNTAMVLENGLLKLQPRQRGDGGHRVIDFFLESLAVARRECAIGVILSGTASDGTQGLEAIKAEGGITFAQDKSAKFDSMPRSAVAAGCVDLVLSPEEISRELGRMAQHLKATAGELLSPALEEMNPADGPEGQKGPQSAGLNKILLQLRSHAGVDFSAYKSNTIQRRINRRLVLNKVTTLEDYARLLRAQPKELDALFSDVLIGVTTFFRNPEVFEVLKRTVFPALLKERREEPLRVWVPGCSSGQEPYSIAMAYLEQAEKHPRAPRLQIFATDLHEGMLNKARNGLYMKAMLENVSPGRLRRFFTAEDGGYRINKPLRDMVVFAQQNVLNDPPFSRIDLISCRNLLIYFQSELHRKLLPTFHYALRPHGFLLLGPSESIGTATGLFEAVDKKHKLFAKKLAPASAVRVHFAPRHPAEKKELAVPRRTNEAGQPEPSAQREADRITLFRYAPPAVLVNAELQVLQFRGDTSPWLKPPTGKATFQLLKMAREGLLLPLRAALKKAKKDRKPVRKENVRVAQDGHARKVSFEVVPLKNVKESNYLIFFEPQGPGTVFHAISGREVEFALPGRKRDARHRIAELENELAEARDYLTSVQEQHEAANEELQSSNEEVISANEELQSINEEMETAKEELEATNEELTTVNEEMTHRNEDLGRLNSDLLNFQGSANVSILLLSRDLAIRRFTAQAARQFNLLPSDVGRPIGGLRHNLDLPDLEEWAGGVIETMQEQEREVRDKTGHWFSVRARPYVSLDNKVEGAVVVVADIDALKRNAQEITQARDYAEAIVRTAHDSLLVLETNLRIHSANDAFYAAFQVSPAETEGRLIYELGNGQWNMPKLRELLEEIIPRNTFFTGFEVTHKFKQLGQRVLLFNARSLTNIFGQPGRILLGIHDATEQRQAEEARKRLAAIVADSHDAIISKNLEGVITSWNEGAERLFGYKENEAMGRSIKLVIPPEKHPEEEEILERVRRGEHLKPFETIRQRKDGSRVEISLSVSPLRDAAGKVIGASKIARDISERKRSEAQLAQRALQQQQLYELADLLNRPVDFEGIYQAALDAIQICLAAPRASVLIAEEDGVMRFKAWRGLSEAYRRVADGHSPWPPNTRDAEPICLDDLAKADMDEKLRQAVKEEGIRALAFIPLVYQGKLAGKFMVYYDAPHPFTDQEIQLAQTIANQLAFGIARKKNEDALRAASYRLGNQARDLTALVGARTVELTRTNQQLEAFVYSIAHDLRGPLRSMQSFSELLMGEGASLSEAGHDFAGRINKSAQAMDRLLMDLLNFSRLGRKQMVLTPVNLEGVVQSAMQVLEQTIREKQAQVKLEDKWPSVQAHEATLTQVLVNLVDNALKFVAPDVAPAIRVRAEERDGQVRVWVEDNGIGIPTQYRDQVFNLFTRLNGGTYPGTGVGLAIVKKGIEHMGGHLGLESEPGKGCRFWFELPKGENAGAAKTEAKDTTD